MRCSASTLRESESAQRCRPRSSPVAATAGSFRHEQDQLPVLSLRRLSDPRLRRPDVNAEDLVDTQQLRHLTMATGALLLLGAVVRGR